MIKPCGDRLLVKPITGEKQTKGGLVVQEYGKVQRGEVIAAGKVQFNVGDTVLYGKSAGDELEWEGEKYKILHEDSIQATL